MNDLILEQLYDVARKLGWTFAPIYNEQGDIIGVILGEDEYVEYLFESADHDDVH